MAQHRREVRHDDEHELLALDDVAHAVHELAENELAQSDMNHHDDGVAKLHHRGAVGGSSSNQGTTIWYEPNLMIAWLSGGMAHGHAVADSADADGEKEALVLQPAWERVARGVGLAYGSVHLIVAAAMDAKRATPAILCALLAALYYATGLPAVRSRARRWGVSADTALRRALSHNVGSIAVVQLCMTGTAAAILVLTLVQHLERCIAVVGMLACMASAFLLCPNSRRGHIRWRHTVAPGLSIQIILAYIVLSTKWGAAMFLALGRGAEHFLAFSYEGSDFVFTAELSSQVFVAFRMLPTIVFFSTGGHSQKFS